MKHIKKMNEARRQSWESMFGSMPKMLGKVDFKAGDIVNVDGHDALVLYDPEVKMSNKRPLSFTYIYVHHLDWIRKGNKDKAQVRSVQMSIAPAKKGKGKPSDMKLALEFERERSSSYNSAVADRQEKNYGQIDWAKNPRTEMEQQCVVMQDGEKAFAGDEVVVKFSNGLFPGKIKSPFTTNKLGEVMVDFGRSKARGIPPRMIMKKR